MVVERHSQWSPTTKPYDTTWFVEPKLFGEGSGYNYARIYRYLAAVLRDVAAAGVGHDRRRDARAVRRAGDQDARPIATARRKSRRSSSSSSGAAAC